MHAAQRQTACNAAAAAPTNPDTVAAEVQRLERIWRETQELATLTALNSLCGQLEARLLQVAEALRTGGGAPGYVGLRWRPDMRLRNAVLAGVL